MDEQDGTDRPTKHRAARRLPVVVAGRREHVEQAASGDAAAGMARLRWDDVDHARQQTVGRALDGQFELALDHADNLLVRMLMFGKRRTGIDLYPRMGLLVGMNEAGAEAREDLANRKRADGDERHPDRLPQ